MTYSCAPSARGREYRKAEQELHCRADSLAYPIRDDIPIMLEAEARITESIVPSDDAR